MSILAQFGAIPGNQIRDLTPLQSSSSVLETVPGLYNETWMRQVSSGDELELRDLTDLPAVGVQVEYELSYVFHLRAEPANSLGTSGSIEMSRNLTTAMNVRLQSLNKELQISWSKNGSPATVVPTGFLVQQGMVVPITMRVRGQSDNNVADGAFEVWLNGDILLLREENINWGNSVNIFSRFEGLNEMEVRGLTSGNTVVRDVVFRNDWSTADNVAPEIPHIIDRFVTATDVVSGTWTAIDGTALDFDDLNDISDTIGVKTLDPNAELVVTMTDLPANTVGLPRGDTTISYRAGRDPFDPTDLTVTPVSDTTGAVATGTAVSTPLTIANPLKQEVQEDLGVVTSNDLLLKITNGS